MWFKCRNSRVADAFIRVKHRRCKAERRVSRSLRGLIEVLSGLAVRGFKSEARYSRTYFGLQVLGAEQNLTQAILYPAPNPQVYPLRWELRLPQLHG